MLPVVSGLPTRCVGMPAYIVMPTYNALSERRPHLASRSSSTRCAPALAGASTAPAAPPTPDPRTAARTSARKRSGVG
eukprot:2270832-Rhodomonas_salina.2